MSEEHETPEKRAAAVARAARALVLVLEEIGLPWPDIPRAVSLVLLDAATRAATAGQACGLPEEEWRIEIEQAGQAATELGGALAHQEPALGLPSQLAALWVLLSDFAGGFEDDPSRGSAINHAVTEAFQQAQDEELPEDPGERFMAVARLLGVEVEGFELIASMTDEELASFKRHQAARRRKFGPTVH